MKMIKILLIVLLAFTFIFGCQLSPIDGTSGTDGTDGTDGEQGIPGEDGQDLTYRNYQVYDNSGDYVGLAYVASYDYPNTSVMIRSTEGYWVYVGSNYYDDYYPMFGNLVVKTSDGKTYSLSVELNWEGATAMAPQNNWYTFVSDQKYDGSTLDIVSYAYNSMSTWEDIGTNTGLYNYTYMEVTPATLGELGLPAYDPPFTYNLVE